MPTIQLHHWVFSKQTYKRQTAGTRRAFFAAGLKRQAVMRRATVHAPTSNFCFQTVHSDWSYECTPNTVNVFEKGITPPGRYVGSQAATTPCRLRLGSVLGSSAGYLYGDCSALW